MLTSDHSPRESGSDQEMEAALYLQKNLDSLGYETSLQEFNTPQIFWTDLHLTSGEGKPLMDTEDSHLHPVSVMLPGDGSATGLLTYVVDALQEDIPDHELEGRIALIDLGATTFREQVDRVADAGAPGAIVLTASDDRFFGTLPYRSTIPVVSVSMSHGSSLIRLLEQGGISATVTVESHEPAASQNVTGEARTDSDRAVILGAHYDTVANSQGASDNGSGLSALLTVARHIAGRDYPFDVRIVLFGFEEFGLFGSQHYVESMSREEIDGTIAMLNFDSLGSGSGIKTSGDYDLTSEAIRIGKETGAPISLEGSGQRTSDHASFEEVGIPTLFLSSNDISRINTPEDTIEHINPDLLGYAAEIGIAMLDWLAEEAKE